jgi:uncharacterized radical SAM superfamily protein
MSSHYQDIQSDGSCDFYEDLNRIKYIKRLLSKYKDKGVLKTRLLINHMIVLINLFGAFPATRILLYKIDDEYHDVVATFLYELDALNVKIIPHVTIDLEVKRMIEEELK